MHAMCAMKGLKKEGKLKQHIKKHHPKVLLQMRKEIYEDKEYAPNDIIKVDEKKSMMIV